jgi:predicted Co/Zn/Cd cation transporter (cation efflux family)
MAFNLFWGAGYFIFSAVTNSGDWAFVLRDLSLEPRWLWRLLMGALGVVLYVLSTRVIAIRLPPGTLLVWPYLVAGVVSCVAALFYAGPTLPAVYAAARESFVSAGGLLFLAYRSSRQARVSPSPILVAHSNGWLLFSALVTILFFLVLGRGIAA